MLPPPPPPPLSLYSILALSYSFLASPAFISHSYDSRRRLPVNACGEPAQPRVSTTFLLTSFSSLPSCLHISPAFLDISVMEIPGFSDLILSRLALSHIM